MIEYIAGKHEWRVSGDFACSTQDQTISLSLRLVLGLFGLVGSWKEMKQLKMKELKRINSFVFSSCSSEEFTCTDGVCIDLIKRFFVFICICLLLCSRRTTLSRCDNLNDCRDKSDEANCKRVGGGIEYKYMLISLYMCFVPICALFQVKMVPTYQKFIVPPPLMTDNMTKVRIISSLKLCHKF